MLGPNLSCEGLSGFDLLGGRVEMKAASKSGRTRLSEP